MLESTGPGEGRLLVGLPDGFDRKLRLGPFPSVRDALKFTTYASVGALAAALLGAVWWLPFLGGGFVLSVYRADGKGLDERFGDLVAWRFRRDGGARGLGPIAPRRLRSRGNAVPAGARRLVALLSVRGLPVAFLPPAEARSLFDRYRELLSALDDGLYLSMGVQPLEERPFRPARSRSDGGPAPTARAGYEEMVRLLCRRRQRRVTLLALWVPREGAGSLARLDRRVAVVEGHLERLGLSSIRLRDRALGEAMVRIGWGGEAGL